jgi:hypothetical protein
MKSTTANPAETRKRRRLSVATQVFIGLGLGLLVGLFFGEEAAVLEVFGTIGATLMQITGFIGRLAPYGVFAITANAAGTIDLSELARLQVYIVLYILLTLLLSLWVIPALIAALTPLRYMSVLRAFRDPLLTALVTANLLIVLPVLAADGKRLIAETDEALGEEPTEQEASAADILIPAAFPFPNLGLLMPAEEATAWTIRYPRFNLVTLEPVLLVPFGYAVARGETELLDFLDAWMINARGSGLLDQLYRYWMLGEIGSVPPPRWSIARNLLGWMDEPDSVERWTCDFNQGAD